MKRRVNKYIEARKRQQGGIVKCQDKLISSNNGRKFYQSNPELVKLYNEEIDRQENEWLNKYYSNQGKLMGINESAEEGYLYGYVPNIIGFDKDKLQNQKPKQIAFDAYNGYASGEYSIPEYKEALYKSVDDDDIRKSKANRILKNLDRYYENEQDRLNDEAWRNAANRLADKVDVSALNTADRKGYEWLEYFGLAASLTPAILAAGYSLPAILNTGRTALGFIGSPLSTTVQGATSLVPSLAQYSWLPTTAAVGDGLYNTAMTIDGFYNLFTDNGVQKTVRLAKDGDVGGAIKSGVGDVFNIIPALSSYKYSRPIQTFIGDLKYAKRYFDHHKGNMNPIEIGYNILRPEFRLLHRATTVNETINPILANAMWLNGGIYNPKVKTALRDIKAILSTKNSWHNWHIKKREQNNLAALYGQQLLANTNIGQTLLDPHIRLNPLSFDELSRVKTHPSQIKSEFKDIPFYQLTGNLSQKTFVPFDWRPVEKQKSGLIYEKDNEVLDEYYSRINDNIAGHYERSKNGLNEVFDIQHYTPTSNSTGYKSRWINRKDNISDNNIKTLIMRKLQDFGIRWIDVAGDNYGLYKSVPQLKFNNYGEKW